MNRISGKDDEELQTDNLTFMRMEDSFSTDGRNLENRPILSFVIKITHFYFHFKHINSHASQVK